MKLGKGQEGEMGRSRIEALVQAMGSHEGGPHFQLVCGCPVLVEPMILCLSTGPPKVSVTQLTLSWFLWPTWSGIQLTFLELWFP